MPDASESPCVLWTGFITPNGYGKTRFRGRTIYTHRRAWEIHNGSIPASMFVLHHCDVRHCMNPLHLFLGTQQDNMDDMRRKGRQRCVRGLDGKFVTANQGILYGQ